MVESLNKHFGPMRLLREAVVAIILGGEWDWKG